MPSVYYPRLIRDGWTRVESANSDRWRAVDTFEKSCPGGWTLRKLAHAEVRRQPGKGCYWDEHVLANKSLCVEHAYPNWEWADLDGERLIWASEGFLFAGKLHPGGIVDQKILFDFNRLRFEAVQAPY